MKDAARGRLLAKAVARLKKTKEGFDPQGGHWRAAMGYLKELADDLKPDQKPTPSVPALGPVTPDGQSLLRLSLTHQTSGLPLYPAVDSGWAGGPVIAPEAGQVTRHSGGESGGYSVYLTGSSGLRYYFTHLNPERADIGHIAKGARIGTVGSPKRFPAQRVVHVHVGINIEEWAHGGHGKQLKYGKTGNGPDYTEGSPAVGVQLKALA